MALPQPVRPFRLGSVVPDFEADTTQGRIKFYDHIGDNWAVLFCYPDDFSPVATSELVNFAKIQVPFASRGVKLLALSTNNQPDGNGEYIPHEVWVEDVNSLASEPLAFPIVNDSDGTLSRLFNVLDEKDVHNLNADNDITEGLAFKSRHVFIIGPNHNGKHHFRLMLNYPAAVGFSTGEMLRVIDCLQTADHASVRTPADWVPGMDVIIPSKISDAEAKVRTVSFSTTPILQLLTHLPGKIP
ncbi:mitochondrial peroxiredoxin PRX1 [Amniculicola lignicola CBS 123094]|uniref:Mitochondrial peroxiredoxin PRX1 n=1 Tax=Amniculicola lignicola CBS 123094 TaxID=1392246 RepID=A0A6A5VZY0_9PLEO|nr:mitochondrial peroxiredoxin PRX1 [Amniculicola lignicola CBS 123094]